MKTALIKHHKAMMKSHAAMAKMLERHGNSMDDDHEFKAGILKLSEHHEELHGHHHELVKALEASSVSEHMPAVGRESNRGGTGSDLATGDLDGPKVFRAFTEAPPDNLRLIHRAGGAPIEKAAVSPAMEDALGNL